VRCLDETGEKEYQYPLYHLSGNEIQSHGTMTYEGPKSIVFFHAYQAGSPDTYRYYQYQDGTMRTPYLSASDGKDHTAASELLVYSGEYAACSIFRLSGRIAFRGVPENTGFTENLQRLV